MKEKIRSKPKIFHYDICGMPFAMRLFKFSKEDQNEAKKIYNKFGLKRTGSSDKELILNIKGPRVKTADKEIFFMLPILRGMIKLTMKSNLLFVHAAGICYEERGLIFPAPSGGGKTTISRMSKGKADIVSDDSVVIKKTSSGYLIYGLPLTRPIFKEVKYRKKAARLSKIYFPIKSSFVKKEPMTKTKALSMILPEVLRIICQGFVQGKRSSLRRYALTFLDELLDNIPFEQLYFSKNKKFLKII